MEFRWRIRRASTLTKCHLGLPLFLFEMKTALLLSVLASLHPLIVTARDLHVLPEGAGKTDGSAWEHALDVGAGIDLLKNGLQPGDRLLVGSGTYRGAEIHLAVSGTEAKPIVIEGVDLGSGLPLFTGNWNEQRPDQGTVAIEIAPGVSHVALRHLRFRDHMMTVFAKSGAARRGLFFTGLDMQRMRHGFYLSDCAALLIEDCHLRRYTKHGFRLESGCVEVTLRRCTADCSEGDAAWEKLTESLPFGFFANAGKQPNARLRFEHCVARNNLMPLQKNSYKNGDGFVIEESCKDVSFTGCRAFRNQDGGFDLKPHVTLKDCVAIGNNRNFRIWTTGTLENCFTGWAPTGLWNNGGPLTVTRCTFHALTHAAIETDDNAHQPVKLLHCLLSAVKETALHSNNGGADIDASNVFDTAKNAAASRYLNPDASWRGDSDALNSAAHPEKGWHWPAASSPKP